MQTAPGTPMQSQFDPHFYYLSNFQQALTWLQERSADLLSEPEPSPQSRDQDRKQYS